jgi:trimethylamine---corrinoid protein Co-methyltransferase
VNDETLALELIASVGPIPGTFIDSEHTRKWWRKEQYIPGIADRLTIPEWQAKGRKTALDYAKEKMAEMLKTHKTLPLTDEQERGIAEALANASKYYRERGMS